MKWSSIKSLCRYLNNKVFASLGNGHIVIYSRDSSKMTRTTETETAVTIVFRWGLGQDRI